MQKKEQPNPVSLKQIKIILQTEVPRPYVFSDEAYQTLKEYVILILQSLPKNRSVGNTSPPVWGAEMAFIFK